MTNPTEIDETILPTREGRTVTVRKGSVVDLAILTEKQRAEYGREVDRSLLKKNLGIGPYTISNIGCWPCGQIMIYVKTSTSSGAGVYARDLVSL